MTDLIVIGGGAAGLTVAVGAARAGKEVILVDDNQTLGGSSLRYNCIPTRCLAQSAQVANFIQNSNQWGLDTYAFPIDIKPIQQRVQQVVSEISAQDEAKQFQAVGGKILFGMAQFLDSHTVGIGDYKYSAKSFVIATGATTFVPGVYGLEEVGYIHHQQLFALKEIPNSLAIMGANAVAVEYAQILNRLGCKVTLIDKNQNILHDKDFLFADKIEKKLISEGVDLQLNVIAENCFFQGKDKVILLKTTNDEEKFVRVDEIMIANNFQANMNNLKLENAGISYNANGIIVNDMLQTNQKHIFALGDVVSKSMMHSHTAEAEAKVVLSNLLYKIPLKIDYSQIPTIVYTAPQLAAIGIINPEQDKHLTTISQSFIDLDAAIIQNCTDCKITITLRNTKVVGAVIYSPNAIELISQLSLAINLKCDVNDLANTVHVYPSLSQAIKKVSYKALAEHKPKLNVIDKLLFKN